MSPGNLRLVPAALKEVLPLEGSTLQSVQKSREAIRALLAAPKSAPSRLLVVVGPCSIHDTAAALDYAQRLAAAAEKHRGELLVAMRVYIEKPRTTVGWKGLVHDPDMTQSHQSDLAKGLYVSRQIMAQVAALGLPVVTEMLSPFVMPFIGDVLACGVIGARTTESQTHRELASDAGIPVGFKNGTDGTLGVAIDAMKSAARPHTLVGVDDNGSLVCQVSQGNADTFMVMRGGKSGPNYSPECIRAAEATLSKSGQPVRLVVDCSHGNSLKDHRNQSKVASSVAQQVISGAPIVGLMLESNIHSGRQDIPASGPACLEYGVSITDACVGWEETESILEELSAAVRKRNALITKLETSAIESAHSVAEVMSPIKQRRSSLHQFVEKFRPNISTFEIV